MLVSPFTPTKNKLRFTARLGLTTVAGLALALAISASNAKEAARAQISARLSQAAASSSQTTAAKRVVKVDRSNVSPTASSEQATIPGKVAFKGAHPFTPTGGTLLYDQTDNPGANATNSQNFETANDAFDDQVADDFVVPAGGWEIGQVNVGGVYFNGPGPANSVNVFFYFDNATLPGAPVPGGTFSAIPITSGAATGNFTILLPTSVMLAPGTYWVSVQANMDFTPGGQWGWNDRTTQSNSGAAFQNPGAGFACSGGNSWVRKPTCVAGADPDNIFQLLTPGGSPPIICPACGPYSTVASTGSIVPGVTDIGNNCDDCATAITLPFPVTLFGQPVTTVNATSNGTLNVTGSSATFGSNCPLPSSLWDAAIFPFQSDLRTDNNTGTGEGIFTAVTGSAPNRTFIIEWRAEYFGSGGSANFEVQFHEGSTCFDIVYGVTTDSGVSAHSGVQASATGPATQFSCNEATLTNGLKVTYCPQTCPAPVPTGAVSRKVHGGAGTFDINLPLVPITGAVGIEDRTQGGGTPLPNIFWYNGDFNDVNGLANEMNTTTTQASVYDNFTVTNPAGWDLTAVFSNNLMTTNVTGATWEIRSGISSGNGGTLVASGSTVTPTVTPTGRSGFGFTEFQVKVTGLNVHLPQLPTGQFYWLNVTPIGDGTGRSFDSQTSGANAIGTPPGNDLNAFFNSSDFAAVFLPTSDPSIGQAADFSMGVIGASSAVGFDHQIVVTFADPIAVGGVSIAGGTGTVASFAVTGNEVTINLTGVADQQRLGVLLEDVCNGNIQGDVLVPMGLLRGDASANRSVNGSDVSLVKASSGAPVTGSNFRLDVNANGSLNGSDIGSVKAASGDLLPP